MSDVTETVLRALVPLKVVLITERPGSEHRALRNAISRAFLGSQSTPDSDEAYFALGEDLGVAVLEVDFATGTIAAREVIDRALASALHCVLVALLYDTPGADFQRWLSEADRVASQDESPNLRRPYLLPIIIKEGVWRGDTQALNFEELGEYALRPAYAAAHVLSCAWRVLGNDEDRLQLFISHAKLDGLPLALSFKNQLCAFHGLERFYDADSIPPGSNWKRILQKGVESSVVIALRTNAYEDRFWCVQELDWAEDYGCPVVMIDARTQLVRAREFLPVGGSPCLYIPDGNLLRVLQAALREVLRVRLFIRQLIGLGEANLVRHEEVLAVPRTSLNTLGMCCRNRARTGKRTSHVFSPEPFREAHREVAEKLASVWFPDAWLGTPRGWVHKVFAGSNV